MCELIAEKGFGTGTAKLKVLGSSSQGNAINDYMEEIWKDVKGFEGVYEISNMGRLASHKVRGGLTPIRKIMSTVNSKGGYFSVILSYEGKKKSTRIHRLVYEAFIGDLPSGKKFHIHHINHNKQDNRAENLVLMSAKEHYYADIETRNFKAMNYYNQKIRPKKISQFTLDGEYIATYNNSQEASDATGVCQRNILQVADKTPFNDRGNYRKQAGGYRWEFAS